MVLKHNKRPFDFEETYQISHKHLRQLDCSGHLSSIAEISSLSSTPEHFPASEGGETNPSSLVTNNSYEVIRSEHGRRLFCRDKSYELGYASRNTDDKIPNFVAAGLDSGNATTSYIIENRSSNAPCNNSRLPWHVCDMYEEDARLESPIGASFFPYFNDDHQIDDYCHLEERHSSVFDYPQRKPVAIGSNYQADIPDWRRHGPKNFVEESDGCVASCSTSVTHSASASLLNDDDSDDRWIGNCVLPMCHTGFLGSEVKGENCKPHCNCIDEGSIRCVRQHVTEAREKLQQMLGQEKFMELGFWDMGEVVAEKWSEEDEQIFQEVVLSNPASLGKNFWNYLHYVFPSRSSKELVSYYFNVFMLRKRAEQNRIDPMNADSDNDEWQASDESESEDDLDDSAVMSPADGDDVTYNGGCDTDPHEVTDDVDAWDDDGLVAGYADDVSYPEKAIKVSNDGAEEQDLQDDSCTSYEGQHHGSDTCSGPSDAVDTHQYNLVEDQKNLHADYRNDLLGGVMDRSYIPSNCSPYFCRTDEDIEFLPTSNMIEEVFGKGAWEHKGTDGHGVS